MNRTKELSLFLQHLDRQTFRDFELIVVDQNPDERLVPVLAPWGDKFPLLHLRSSPGASRARNLGLRQARAPIVAFPDDDCWYPPALLTELMLRWAALPAGSGIITGIGWNGVPSRGRARHCSRSMILAVAGACRLFIPRDFVLEVGGFDEGLGPAPNTKLPAGEDLDLALRILSNGKTLTYDPRIWVGHPAIKFGRLARSADFFRGYGRSTGMLLRRHRFSGWFHRFRLVRSACGIAFALARGRRGDAAIRWHGLVGRIEGWQLAPLLLSGKDCDPIDVGVER